MKIVKFLYLCICIFFTIQCVNCYCESKIENQLIYCDQDIIILKLFNITKPIEYKLNQKLGIDFMFDVYNYQEKSRLCDISNNDTRINFQQEIFNVPNIPTTGGDIYFDGFFICKFDQQFKDFQFLNQNKNIISDKIIFHNDILKLSTSIKSGCGEITIVGTNNYKVLNYTSFMPANFDGDPIIKDFKFELNGSNLYGASISITNFENVREKRNVNYSLNDKHTSLNFIFGESEYQGTYTITLAICDDPSNIKKYTYSYKPIINVIQNFIVPIEGINKQFDGKNLKVYNNATFGIFGKTYFCNKITSTFSTIECQFPKFSDLNNNQGYDLEFFILFDGVYKSNSFRFSYDLPRITESIQDGTSNVFQLTGEHFDKVKSVIVNVDGKDLNLNLTGEYNFKLNSITSITLTVPYNTVPGYLVLNMGDFKSMNFNFFKIIPTLNPTTILTSDTGGNDNVIFTGKFLKIKFLNNTLIPLVIGGKNSQGRTTGCNLFEDIDGLSFSCKMKPGIGINYTLNAIFEGKTNLGNYSFSYKPPNLREFTQQNEGSIKITGSSLGNDPSVSLVRMISDNTVIAKVRSSDHNSMIFEVPTNPPKSGYLEVNVLIDGINKLNYTLRPIISSVNSVPCSGGDVTIAGYYFYKFVKESTFVYLQKQICNIISISENGIICNIKPTTIGGQTPISTSGIGKPITITGAPFDVINNGPVKFNYLPPSITNFSKISTKDYILTIQGDSFNDFNLEVLINGSLCKFPFVCDFPVSKTLTCKISEDSLIFNSTDNLYNLTVIVDGQSASIFNFTYFFEDNSIHIKLKTDKFPDPVYIGISIFVLFLICIGIFVHNEIIKYRKAKRARKAFEQSEAIRLEMRAKHIDKIKYVFKQNTAPKPKSKIVEFLKKRPFLKRLFKKSFEQPLPHVDFNTLVNQQHN